MTNFQVFSFKDGCMDSTIHAARIVDRGDIFWFASLNGEDWIEVSDDPRRATVNQIDALMNPKSGTYPLRATRGFIRQHGAVFLTGERHA